MILSAQCFTVGKTDRRNDDMLFVVELFRHQVLGVLGDFTSDSPQGVNEACSSHLQAFVADKLATWREMLLPPERLLPLLLRKTNDFLADYGQKAQTTLIVFSWDLRSEDCHFISVGDSGLACVGPNGVRYLREGDRDGLRISAGFLPGAVDATVMVAPVRRDETLFAFSDGLWENTKDFMSDALLLDVFSAAGLDEIGQRLQARILNPAIRKDDLSILVMKGETMERQGTHTLDSEQLERLIGQAVERRVDALVGAGSAGEPTPVERDLLRWLDDAPRLQRQLADVLGDQLGRTIEGQVKKQLDEQREMFQRQLDEQQRRLEDQLRDQSVQIKRLEKELGKGGGSSRASESRASEARAAESSTVGRPASQPSRSKPTETSAKPVAPKSSQAHTVPTSANSLSILDHIGFKIGLIAVLVVAVGLFAWNVFFSKPKPKAEGTQSEQQVDGTTTPKVDETPEPEPPARVNYQAAPISKGLLAVVNLDQTTYTQQAAAIATALSGLNAAPTGNLPLADSPGLSELKLSANFKWQQYKKASPGMVSKIWLQAQAGAVVDGATGQGTIDKFSKKFSPQMDACQRLAALLDKPVIADLDKAILDTYRLKDDVYLDELRELGRKIKAKGRGKSRLELAWYRDKRYLTISVLVDQEPIRAWLELVQAKNELTTGDLGLPIRAIWLAAQVELAESSGATDDKLKQAVAPFAKKSCSELLNEDLKQWK